MPIMRKSFAAALLPISLAACATAATPPATEPGPDFLARNAAAKDVVSLPSGLQYFVLASGPKTGVSPKPGDTVNFDYEGKLTDGTTFDSSFERGEPLVGEVGNFVPGFDAALSMMRPGDDWIVWIPPELGYGDSETGPIPANSVLRFRLKLNSVSPAPQAQ
jgi:FKBP-type peptidyl-prolyl cis-trans isomerase FklB